MHQDEEEVTLLDHRTHPHLVNGIKLWEHKDRVQEVKTSMVEGVEGTKEKGGGDLRDLPVPQVHHLLLTVDVMLDLHLLNILPENREEQKSSGKEIGQRLPMQKMK